MSVVPVQTVSGIASSTDANFNAIIPDALNYAELRIQRDLDPLALLESSTSTYTLAPGANTVSIPVSDFYIVEAVFANGTPLIPTTKEFLQNVCGSPSSTGVPAYFAVAGGDSSTQGNTSTIILVGPYAASATTVGIYGKVRPVSLYSYSGSGSTAGSSTTFISSQLPDLLIMASMIYISGYQRNFGRQSDDPQMAQSFENQYQTLLKGAIVEEARRRFRSTDWSPMAPPLIAGVN
jgi:hypothetical protein